MLDWTRLKAFEEDIIKAIEKLKNVSGWVGHIVRKGENAVFQHFLLFPQCLQKASFFELLKVGIV